MIFRCPGVVYIHCATALMAGLLASSAQAAEWVTAAELVREAEHLARTPAARTRAVVVVDPDAPLIEVLRPQPLNNLKQPFPVELRFTPRAGVPIDPKSLRVSYGFMGIDLTDRIRKSATVTADGLRAESVEIPRGEHRLTVKVADAKGLVGEKEIRIRVGE